MGFRSAQQSNEQTEAADRSTAHSPATESATQQSTPDPSMMGQIWPSIERAEGHFGMRIPDESTLQRLEDHERAYGRETHEWIAEGMPTDIMGSPKSMEAFRQRQAERPPEVPTNIERQNRRSVLRSEKAASDTSTAGGAGVPEPVRDVISSTGRSLDGSIQRAMEDRMGDSFGDVRIHTGSTAAEACESINARAFTVGNHIAFNSGEYDPSSPEGQHVLAHELAHVRQQNQGAVSMLPQENVELEVDPDPALEREAEEAAQQAMAEGPVVVNRMGCDVQIQRSTDTATPSNAESISELQQEIADLKATVNDHDDTLSEIEGAQEDVEELVEEFDGDGGTIDLDLDDGGNRSVRDRIGDALDNFNVLGRDGKQNATEGLVAGGLTGVGLLATLATGGAAAPAVAGLATATLSPALRGAASDAVVENDTAVPSEIATQLGSALAKSEEFAKEIGSNSALAKQVAKQLDNAIYEGPTGDGDSQNVGKSGEVTN